ncbi:MAG: hypothetical protein MZV70_42150 [Desulfobacterales bacterium]|nr:hypothetical protein [Desulfobacterales bacterium]
MYDKGRQGPWNPVSPMRVSCLTRASSPGRPRKDIDALLTSRSVLRRSPPFPHQRHPLCGGCSLASPLRMGSIVPG